MPYEHSLFQIYVIVNILHNNNNNNNNNSKYGAVMKATVTQNKHFGLSKVFLPYLNQKFNVLNKACRWKRSWIFESISHLCNMFLYNTVRLEYYYYYYYYYCHLFLITCLFKYLLVLASYRLQL